MKIKRLINGVTKSIELTEAELRDAYWAYQELMDICDIRECIESVKEEHEWPDSFIDDILDDEDFIRDTALMYRANYNSDDSEWDQWYNAVRVRIGTRFSLWKAFQKMHSAHFFPSLEKCEVIIKDLENSDVWQCLSDLGFAKADPWKSCATFSTTRSQAKIIVEFIRDVSEYMFGNFHVTVMSAKPSSMLIRHGNIIPKVCLKKAATPSHVRSHC